MPTNSPAILTPKIGHMTYLNSEVFYRKLSSDSCELVPLPPRAMAAALERGELQAGPLPIAEVVRLGGKVRSLGNMGVACDGPAMSVFLFSHQPVKSLSGSSIAVTPHTATSIQMLRVLFADLWNVSGHRFVDLSDQHEAALIIGDPALEMFASKKYPYSLDLGSAWKSLTGMPFVFAEWVVRTDTSAKVAEKFERELIAATWCGLESIDEIARARSNKFMSESDVAAYVQNFSYFFGPDERSGQKEFERRLSKLPVWRPQAQETTETTEEKAISAS